jgi:hypothetical protein
LVSIMIINDFFKKIKDKKRAEPEVGKKFKVRFPFVCDLRLFS